MVTRRSAAARGFTMIELMIALVVVAALAAVAIPATKEMIAKSRLRSASGDLANTLMRARSFAVKLQVNVTVLPVNAASWQTGWSVPDPDPAGSGYLFDARNALAQVEIAGPASVVYKSNGRPVTPATAFYTVSAPGTTEKRCVKLELSGMPTDKKGTC